MPYGAGIFLFFLRFPILHKNLNPVHNIHGVFIMKFFRPIPAQFQPNFTGFLAYKPRLEAGFRVSVYIIICITERPIEIERETSKH